MTALLDRAEILRQSENYSGSGAWLDESGNGHDAQFGSTAGADTNDPLFLPYDGTQYLRLPGLVGNSASTPDAVGLDVTGNIDIRVRMAMDDWSPVGQLVAVGKWLSAGSQQGWLLRMHATTVNLYHSADGSAVLLSSSSVAVPFADGDIGWVRVTMDVDDGSGNHVVTFYTSTDVTNDPDAVEWTGLGSVQVKAGTTNIFNNTSALEVGIYEDNAANPFAGSFYRVTVYDGIDGTKVFDADFTDQAALTEPFATFTEKSSNAATVTINRTATGRKSTVVDTDMMLRGIDDYHEVPDAAGLDFAADDSFTLMSVVREYDVTPSADMILAAKKADLTTSIGYAFYLDTTGVPTFVIDDGTNPPAEATGPTLTDGQSHVVAAVRNTATDKITVYTDGVAGTPVTDSTVTTLANAEVLRFGRLSGAGTNYIDGETIAEVLWREALTDQEIIGAGMDLGAGGKGLMMLLGVM